MSSLTDYAENKIIDAMFRGGTITWPGTWYLAMFTVAPTDAGGGTEVTGGSYARGSLACTGSNFTNTQNSGTGVSTGSGGTTTNAAAIANFPAPTADWGRVVAVALMDASTSGNMWVYGPITPKNINNGDPAPTIPIGSLSFQLDN